MGSSTENHPAQLVLGALLLVTFLSADLALGAVFSDWITDARATMFASPGDYWQMSMGHCQYGYLNPNKCTGWDVAAVADKNRDYNSGTSNCGVCYEVQCQSGTFKDGYGETLDRTTDCFNTGASVIVQTIDLCECNYAPNYASNKRWCCGDMQHLDLSRFAFEKLAPWGKGVIMTKYRRVSCDHQPDVVAQRPPGVPASPAGEQPPWNWDGTDGRSCPSGTSSDATRSKSKTPKTSQPKPKPKPSGSSSKKTSTNLSVGRWSINSWSGGGINGRTAQACGTLLPWGGYTLQGNLQNKKRVEVWVKREGGNLPNVVAKLNGKGCSPSKHINSLQKTGYSGDYVRVKIPLISWGCRGVYKIVLQNNIGNWGWQNFCIDGARSS